MALWKDVTRAHIHAGGNTRREDLGQAVLSRLAFWNEARCRMHGGNSPGAPKGNRNAWKHGRYCESAMAERRQARAAINRLRELMTLFRECESEP